MLRDFRDFIIKQNFLALPSRLAWRRSWKVVVQAVVEISSCLSSLWSTGR